MGHQGFGHHGGEGGVCHEDQCEATHKRLVSHIDMRVTSVVGMIGRASGKFGTGEGGDEKRQDLESKVLAELVAAVEDELDHLEIGTQATVEPEPGVPGRVKVQWNASGTHYERDYPGRNDGRLSFEEFTRVLYSAGVSWLTRDELQSNFDVMDVDESGYLSLGEVLRVSERLVQRLRQLREFESSLMDRSHKAGQGNRKFSFAELIEKFVRQSCPELLDNPDSTRRFTHKSSGGVDANATSLPVRSDKEGEQTKLPNELQIAVNGKEVGVASLKPPQAKLPGSSQLLQRRASTPT